MDALVRDIRHAVRTLGKQRAFTLTALTLLALGIGANTAMFGIVSAMMLRPLPYPDPEGIVSVGETYGPATTARVGLTNRTMFQLQENTESFERVAGYQAASVNWASPDGVLNLDAARVSPSLFPLLRAGPQVGRLFTEDEARIGADRVVVLSSAAWRRHFGSDPDIVGTIVDLDGDSHTVVGVVNEGFYFPSPDTEIWTPFVIPPVELEGGIVATVMFNALGRLRPGVSPVQAETEVRTILRRGVGIGHRREGALSSGDTPQVDAQVVPLQEQMVAEYRPALLALSIATALVLLIACSNVAGLLLAHGVARQRGLAIRAALGASRGRLVRQLLTESVVLGLGGGALGLATAAVVLRAVPALVPGDIARLDEVGVDGVVLAFTFGLSVIVGLTFGAVSAFQWSQLQLARVLNEGSEQSAGGFRLLRANRARALLATAQVALAVVLLVGAGLFLRSFVRLITIDRGYDPVNVIAARTQSPDLRFRLEGMTPDLMFDLISANQRFHASLLEAMARMERLPNVEAVGLSSSIPLPGNGDGAIRGAWVRIAGRALPNDPRELPHVTLQIASSGYFDVLRLPLRSGRLFSRFDEARSPRVIVVNEAFEREVFGGGLAVGQRVHLDLHGNDPWEVIGVVGNTTYRGLTRSQPQAEAFVPVRQAETEFGFQTPFVTVRTAGDPLAVVPFLREAVVEAHPRGTIDDVMTMDARLSLAVAQPRFYAGFVGSFAALALFLAAFGVSGLLSYTVAQRRREIGVRMALGAQPGDIVSLVVRQGAALIATGAAAGLFAAAASSRVLESFLYGVTTSDGLTFVLAPLVLIAVAVFSCWLPARRATRINATDALRVV